jgi:hypothetical protein
MSFDLISGVDFYTFENFGRYWKVLSGSFVFEKSE